MAVVVLEIAEINQILEPVKHHLILFTPIHSPIIEIQKKIFFDDDEIFAVYRQDSFPITGRTERRHLHVW